MISFALDEEEELLQATVRRVATEQIRPRLRQLEQGVPSDVLRTVAELGLPTLTAAEADGGQGARLLTQLLALEELAAADAGGSVALCPSESYIALLSSLGTEDERARLLRPVVEGTMQGAVAYCADHGEALQAIASDGGAARLTGRRRFVLGAQTATRFLVLDDAQAFVVDRGEGVSVEPDGPLLALDAAQAGTLVLSAAPATRLSVPDLVSRLPRALLAMTLRHSTRQLGLARAAYEHALDYTQERKAFGKAIAHFQAIAFELSELAIAVDSARWLLWRGADALDKSGDLALAAAAIVQANEVGFRCADRAVQLLGGAGFIRDFPVEKWLRETKALALLGVPTEWCREVIAAVELGTPIEPPSTWLQPFYT